MTETEGIITDDTESFIESIEKRPALYLKSLKEYSDVNFKKKMWEEVCLEVVSGWTKLTPERKHKIGVEVQKKWLNLRTCFSRELKAQQTKSGQAASKRRRYIYFEKLLFLKSSLAQRPTESNIHSSEDDDNMQADEVPPQPPKNVKSRNISKDNDSFQQSLLKVLQEDIDEDKNFALSLVPSLKSLSEDEKLGAKIEILQVFQRIKRNRQAGYQRSVTPVACHPHYSQLAGSSSTTINSTESVQNIWSQFSPSPQSDILDI